MEPVDITQRVQLLEKQIESMLSLHQDTRLNLVSAIDTLRIEVETSRAFLQRLHPELKRVYPRLKEEVVQETDPEWTGGAPGRAEK